MPLPNVDVNVRATECITRVRRTFILTFCLMFLTLAVLFGTTERFSASETTFEYQPASAGHWYRIASSAREVPGNTDVKNESTSVPVDHLLLTNDSPDTPQYIATERTDTFTPDTMDEYRPTYNSAPKPPKFMPNQLDTNNQAPQQTPDGQTFVPNLPAPLTKLQPLGPGMTESQEFPGMPDPCQQPRRSTGVEDLLCMVGIQM